MRLHLGRSKQVSSFAELVKQMPDREFKKLTRSTVRLLSWWNDRDCVQSVGKALGLGNLHEADAWFEYSVPPQCASCHGRGRASSTDLLLKLGDQVVAVEAKHREKLGKTVRKWLGPSGTDNKKRVLQHWLGCCLETAASLETPASLEPYEQLDYQMVHRTASARHIAAQHDSSAHVVYLLFESKHVGAYKKAVHALANVLGGAGKVRLDVVSVPAPEACAFTEVALEHQRRGADALREALAAGKRLFELGRPESVFSRR
jgi:hypothetical protein